MSQDQGALPHQAAAGASDVPRRGGLLGPFRALNQRVSRAIKLGVLLLCIVAVLVATAFLDRSTQVSLLKIFLVLFLSLLPGWLYLQFVEVKGGGLYDEYVLNLFRLKIDDRSNLPKPPPGYPYWDDWHEALRPGVDPGQNIYLKKFENVYGHSAIPEARRHLDKEGNVAPSTKGKSVAERIKVDAFVPVVLMTILLGVGWSAVMIPELLGGIQIYSGVTDLPRFPSDLLRFAFIGSYVFILQQMVRRYFHYDLKSGAYVSGMMRVIIAAAVVVALHPIAASLGIDENVELTLAFLIGFFPDYGFRLAWQFMTGRLGGRNPTEEERYPLSEIDGLDIWTRSRLLEEGIEDMENLATANLVDLMLNTRTPVSRMIDWIDQSFLYLRLTGEDRTKLRKLGIRTATDLIDAFDPRGSYDDTFRDKLLRYLNADDSEPSATEGIRRSLEGEVNLWHIREWKGRSWLVGKQQDAEDETKQPEVESIGQGEPEPADAETVAEAEVAEAEVAEADLAEAEPEAEAETEETEPEADTTIVLDQPASPSESEPVPSP